MSKTFTPFLMIVVLLSGVTAILLALTFRAEAQPDGSVVKIGVIGAPEEPRFSEIVAGLQSGFSELGYDKQELRIL
jgi:hypothetical protein